MTRFMMTNRRAGKFDREEKLSSRKALDLAMDSSFIKSASILRENTPERDIARKVVLFESDEKEVKEKIKDLDKDVIVEPEILHYTDSSRPSEVFGISRNALLAGPIDFGTTVTLSVTIHGNGLPLHGAKVTLYLRSGGQVRTSSRITTRQGKARFIFSNTFDVSSLVVVPAFGFWSIIIRNPLHNSIVECPPLPTAQNYRGWWHKLLGIRQTRRRGNGIKVGVVDTGCGPHDALNEVQDIGAFIDGQVHLQHGKDINSHGSHVCGIIGARPQSRDRFAGIAPGVELFSSRVFAQNEEGANQIDIAKAIDALSREYEVDLINLSLGSPDASEIVRDAIIDAAERGTLCVCAAGNSRGKVEFPAAFAETMAISAIGMEGQVPIGSTSGLPNDPSRFGTKNLYHADFSCFGPQISGAAPGVGIISTVPEQFGLKSTYGVMSGTSMASPMACAVLAALLSTHQDYTTIPRNNLRTENAKTQFQQSCQDIGLATEYQGYGMPVV